MRAVFSLLILLSLLLVSCADKESDASNDAMDNNFTILRGSVPGTLIEAFCEDGSYHKTHSVQNGTAQHPFTLKVPRSTECYLIMTTNENTPNDQVITTLEFNVNGEVGPLFKPLEDSIDLGFIDLALRRDSAVVVDELYEITLDEGVDIIFLEDDPLDSDGDGIIDLYEDYDADGISNYYDYDDDNDGIYDLEDSDDNGDGVIDTGYFIDYGYSYFYDDYNESEVL